VFCEFSGVEVPSAKTTAGCLLNLALAICVRNSASVFEVEKHAAGA
jgi:hypothetical protein